MLAADDTPEPAGGRCGLLFGATTGANCRNRPDLSGVPELPVWAAGVRLQYPCERISTMSREDVAAWQSIAVALAVGAAGSVV
jgi:hypothetical protein